MVNQKQMAVRHYTQNGQVKMFFCMSMLHRKIDVVMKTRPSVVNFYRFKFEFWFGYHAMG